jgi:hypothetical protein
VREVGRKGDKGRRNRKGKGKIKRGRGEGRRCTVKGNEDRVGEGKGARD